MRSESRSSESLSRSERDRRKEADLVRAGYRVLRATWLQLEREPNGVALMLRAALDAPFGTVRQVPR